MSIYKSHLTVFTILAVSKSFPAILMDEEPSIFHKISATKQCSIEKSLLVVVVPFLFYKHQVRMSHAFWCRCREGGKTAATRRILKGCAGKLPLL